MGEFPQGLFPIHENRDVTEKELFLSSMKDSIVQGDCMEVLKVWPAECVDCMVTDPPYGYSFMGKDWDRAVPHSEMWEQCLRVLKPGAFAFIMSAPRLDVLSEMAKKLKLAGFEVGFTPIFWAYASGFPKAMNISKAVDKKLGVEFKPNEKLSDNNSMSGGNYARHNLVLKKGAGSIGNTFPLAGMYLDYDKPITAEAQRLDGAYGGFQPKPAVEVIIVAMKPMDEKASKGEKNEGCHDLEAVSVQPAGLVGAINKGTEKMRMSRTNFHPTVKPVDLMSYLVVLGSRKDDVVLDPFCGSGSTCVAARLMGRRFVGVELVPEYAEIARKRISWVPKRLDDIAKETVQKKGLERLHEEMWEGGL